MNNTILKKISDFVKKNNISTCGVYYKFSNDFPESFYDTAMNYLTSVYPRHSSKTKIDNFFIGFDDNKNAYFEFFINETNTRIIVLQDNIHYTNLPAAKILKEGIFLENVKNLDNAKNAKILNSLPQNFITRFIKEENKIEPIDNFFNLLSQQIIEYINYLNIENKKMQDLLQMEYDEAKKVEKIYFVEAESSQNTNRMHISKQRIQTDRKNNEISIEDRIKVLDDYSPLEEFEAISSNSSSTYYVKVFKVKEKCKLIIEPLEGNKYTKVVHLDTDKLDKVELKKIAIDTLQLDRKETTKKDNVTRHSHTTLEEYKNLLEYLINEKNDGISSTTKINIDEASGIRKR